MLKKLTIQNYAIIDELEIEFSSKMNIVTGETGAGKSIIVGAVGLILGERADSSILVHKEKKCVVEGSFLAEKRKEVKDFLKENELDAEDELVIRREVSANGKSRAFINDTPVNLDQLRQLSSLLVDLHQQFETLQLGENDFQRQVLDALAGQTDLLNEYRFSYSNLREVEKKCEELKLQKQQFDKESDYNRFQYNELAETRLRENELEEIDAEMKLLNNAEGIKSALSKVSYELKENDKPVVQQLKILWNQLQSFSSFHPTLPSILQRLQSAQIELQDIADEVDNISSQVNYDPKKIEQLDLRLSIGYKLLKKHGVKTTSDLLQIQKQLEDKLQAVMHIDEAILQMEKEVALAQKTAIEYATRLSEGRHMQVKPLEEKVNRLLAKVGMPNAKLKVEVKNEPELNSFGANSIEFLFNANLPSEQVAKGPNGEPQRNGEARKNIQFMPVKKVASGGELNRLMLCIKSLVAKRIDLPTMIFDEIDTGISGEAARQTGIVLKELAEKRQIVCITHQPQIAGKADAHFFVYKEIVKDAIKTNIRLLTMEERITAIAKMLSGEKPTAAAIENAREMVRN